jgi:hypothetical protein
MKIDTLAHVKNQISSVVEHLGSEPLFITRNGKVAAVLQAVTDDEIEDYLLRNSPRFWRMIESRRGQARIGKTLAFNPESYFSDDVKSSAQSAVHETSPSYKTTRRRRPR